MFFPFSVSIKKWQLSVSCLWDPFLDRLHDLFDNCVLTFQTAENFWNVKLQKFVCESHKEFEIGSIRNLSSDVSENTKSQGYPGEV